MEHVTTAEACRFVAEEGGWQGGARGRVAATVTPQHMLLNRNDLLVGGLRPHHYCLPVLKRDVPHRESVAHHATSGFPAFFLGTDSAPHPKGAKESACGCAGCFSAPVSLPLYAEAFDRVGALGNLEGFASHHGADFYGLPRNKGRVRLQRVAGSGDGPGAGAVPAEYRFGDDVVVPLRAGGGVGWTAELLEA